MLVDMPHVAKAEIARSGRILWVADPKANPQHRAALLPAPGAQPVSQGGAKARRGHRMRPVRCIRDVETERPFR